MHILAEKRFDGLRGLVCQYFAREIDVERLRRAYARTSGTGEFLCRTRMAGMDFARRADGRSPSHSGSCRALFIAD